MRLRILASALVLGACADDSPSRSKEAGSLEDIVETPCGAINCQPGFHCEFDACVANAPPPPPPPPPMPGGEVTDPLASQRYVFNLERTNRRLTRIDSETLEVAVFPAGLGPMDLAVVGSRELTVLLDALDVIEILDHRSDPPLSAAWETARSLSHLVVSPTGEHAIAYYDWDDPRAQLRQSEPGNINQVSVLALEDRASPLSDADVRLTNVAVDFLPRDVRFSRDGSRAVVIGRSAMTPIVLGTAGIAEPQMSVDFDSAATEIAVTSDGLHAVLRYAPSPQVDVIELATGNVTCFGATGVILDIGLTPSDELLINSREPMTTGSNLSLVPISAASAGCTALPETVPVTDASRLVIAPAGDAAIAHSINIDIETIWRIELSPLAARPVQLEKAVGAVVFTSTGERALLSHLKRVGVPQWNPTLEDPEVSVDKSYGVSWFDTATDDHRLAVSDVPFGGFAFVPSADGGATYQAVLDPRQPQVLRVSHAPGFHDRWLDLAALPLNLGFLPETDRAYVTQDHPWGRVTFIDTAGVELRHVTGFALEVQP